MHRGRELDGNGIAYTSAELRTLVYDIKALGDASRMDIQKASMMMTITLIPGDGSRGGASVGHAPVNIVLFQALKSSA